MFSQWYDPTTLQETLIPRSRFKPFPRVDERGPWEDLSGPLRQSMIQAGTAYHNWQWPALPATLFMDFKRTGNRRNYEAPHFARRRALETLIVAECAEDEGRFIDDIINGIWCVCEESFWGVPAHASATGPLPDTARPIIDLFAAETAALMAWALYLLQPRLDAVSPMICQRIHREIKLRLLDPFLTRDDFWWMGLAEPKRRLNNWTPWCISNCLTALLLCEKEPTRRTTGVSKALRILDGFLAPYPKDGGCDEGTSYWNRAGGSLFDCLELLYMATHGQICVYDNRLVQDIGRYLYRLFISDSYFVNFADGGAKVNIAADLVYRYGRRIHDPSLSNLGSGAHHARGEQRVHMQGSLLRLLPAIFNFEAMEKASEEPPYIKDSWLPQIQCMTARETDSSRGLFLAAKGGHNAESHNHNDVGQFIVYADGQPVIIDVGVGTYTAKTFSSRRYDIWTMQSAFHNVPSVNGVHQQAGRDFCARQVNYKCSDTDAELQLDIAAAYPETAGIEFWRRTMRLARGAAPAVYIEDDFSFKEPSAEIVLALMAAQKPEPRPDNTILLNAGRVILYVTGGDLQACVERIDLDDDRLKASWGESIYRILLRPTGPLKQGSWVMKFAST